ncbi:MAG: SAM-dependent methyltransferase, partial [Candidatus Zipacnadales bacterium]
MREVMASEWYENYFDEIYLCSYGWRLDRAPAETETILRLLDLPSGASILDLGCGQGRHVVELARRGYQVTGLDLSRVLLQKAQELAQKMGVGVELVEEDMRRIPETWAARFDGIINVFTTWG